MENRIRLFIGIAITLAILLQSLINVYLFRDSKTTHQISASDSSEVSGSQQNINHEIISLLTNIDAKLDTLNQNLASNSENYSANKSHESADTSQAKPIAINKQQISEIKYSLLTDMSRYDMTLPSFVSDPRLVSLPEKDKQEILNEMTRRIDSGEINKKTFLPGYNPK